MSRMNARYAGTCTRCHGHFPEGTEIEYDRATRKASHVECPAVPAPAPVVARADIRALVAAAIVACETATAAVVAAWATRREATEKRDAAFAAAGLCPTCKGVGYYEVRWSMDAGCVDTVGCECAKATGRALTREAIINASPEVAAIEDAYIAALSAANNADVAKDDAERKLSTLCEVQKGDEVEVVKGRKVAKGTRGFVIWMGEGFSPRGFNRHGWGNYRNGPTPARVGIKDEAGTVHWTAASNVEVVSRAANRVAA